MDQAGLEPSQGIVNGSKTEKSEMLPVHKFPKELRFERLLSMCEIPRPLDRTGWRNFAPARYLAAYFMALDEPLMMLAKLVQAISSPDGASIAFIRDANTVLNMQLSQIEQDVFSIVAQYDKEYKHRCEVGLEYEWFTGSTKASDTTESILTLFKKKLQTLYIHHHEHVVHADIESCDNPDKRWNLARLHTINAIHHLSNLTIEPTPYNKAREEIRCNHLFSLSPPGTDYATLSDHSKFGPDSKPWTLLHFPAIGQSFLGKNFGDKACIDPR